jgi:FAD-dependent urate hydroxylase
VDGTRYDAELVVGADGYRSAVRRAVLGGEPAAATGWVTWQGLTGALPDLAAGTYACCLVGRAGLCGLMPAGDGLVQWWFDVAVPAPPGQPVVGWLRERFAGYAEPVRTLLESVTEADVQMYPHVLHRVPRQWGRGAVTLLGDAAHAFPPSQAQGANQALEDAWLLRRTLRAPGPVADGLRRYEQARARRVRRVARLAASEVTNRPPTAAARLAGRLLSPGLAAHLQLAVIRRCSSVLHGERA